MPRLGPGKEWPPSMRNAGHETATPGDRSASPSNEAAYRTPYRACERRLVGSPLRQEYRDTRPVGIRRWALRQRRETETRYAEVRFRPGDALLRGGSLPDERCWRTARQRPRR